MVSRKIKTFKFPLAAILMVGAFASISCGTTASNNIEDFGSQTLEEQAQAEHDNAATATSAEEASLPADDTNVSTNSAEKDNTASWPDRTEEASNVASLESEEIAKTETAEAVEEYLLQGSKPAASEQVTMASSLSVPEEPKADTESVASETDTSATLKAISSELVTSPAPAEAEAQSEETVAAEDTAQDAEKPESQEQPVAQAAPSTPKQLDTANREKYIVMPGDNLSSIAEKIYGKSIKWKELAEINSISNPNKLLPGDVILYPKTEQSEKFAKIYEKSTTKRVTVSSGDTLSKIAARVLGDSSFWKTIWQLNITQIPDPNKIKVGMELVYIDHKQLALNLKQSEGNRTQPSH
jgi:nucleoid-associated protein YgaU